MIPIICKGAKCTSNFGNRTYKYQGRYVSDFHYGIDLVTTESNANPVIIAFEDGEVTKVVNTGSQYGTMCQVVLKHSNGFYTRYYHLKSGSIVVKVGDKVKKSQKLGIMGTTGQSTGSHLHFQIDKGSQSSAINPYDYVFNNKELVTSSSSSNKKLYLPKTATSWRVYKQNVKPVVGNECGFLRPSRFGGLTYDILGYTSSNVALIQTRDFGKVQIYVAPSTGAVIK